MKVSRSATVSSVVARVAATDADSPGLNSRLSYDVVQPSHDVVANSDDDDELRAFHVDRRTGVVTLQVVIA